MKTVGILGCGWLGLPLARKLSKLYTVRGTTTSRQKLGLLEQDQIRPFLLTCTSDSILGDAIGFFRGLDCIIVNIPPGLRRDPGANYLGKIKVLQNYLRKYRVKKIIYVSSISVYEDVSPITWYTEKDDPRPQTGAGNQLWAAEQLLLSDQHLKCTVLRLGGLVGPGRHPVQSLSGRKEVANPNAPINLVHLDDCVKVVMRLLSTEAFQGTYNIVSPFHPTRQEYYQLQAVKRNLAVPEFQESEVSKGKVVASDRLWQDLQIQLDKEI